MTEYQEMIEDCKNRESRLTEWEIGFIDSIGRRLEANNGLSPKQEETLERIWGRVTS